MGAYLSHISILFLSVVFLMNSSLQKAHAWGNEGHYMICHMAQSLLNPEEQAELKNLIRSFEFDQKKYSSFAYACKFADLARIKARRGNAQWKEAYSHMEKWHYLNLKRNDTTVEKRDCDEREGCLFSGIGNHRLQMSSANELKRAEAVILLGHWMSDLHQPLHVSFEDDFGGGRIVISGELYAGKNLHQVWDTELLKTLRRKNDLHWKGFANLLLSEITPENITTWSQGTLEDWAQESYEISRSPDVKYCEVRPVNYCKKIGRSIEINRAYQNQHEKIVRLQIKKASVRLYLDIKKYLFENNEISPASGDL